MNKTKIEWCDYTWNPVTGCLHGCPYCYARTVAKRFGSSDHETGQIHEQAMSVAGTHYYFGFDPTLHKYRLSEPSYKKDPQTIFVVSMGDLFGKWVPYRWIADVFEACRNAPQHRYLFLTKNPKRYSTMAELGVLPQEDNFWYGTTVTGGNSGFFSDKRFNTFLSIEPLLEPAFFEPEDTVDWIIIGAETGNRAGKVTPQKEWIDAILRSAGPYTPVFMKDSLVPIVGAENMLRETPWTFGTEGRR